MDRDDAKMAGLDGPVAWRAKSFPASGIPLAHIPEERWSLFSGEFWFPVLVLRQSALEHNIAGMARLCHARGVSLAPHGKTTMAPSIIRRQLDAGAWAITAATPWQARAMRGFGVRRILLANQVVEPDAIRWMGHALAADPGFEIMCCVDSVEGVNILGEALAGMPLGRTLPVLVEVGEPGGRAGCRTIESGTDVARAVRGRAELELAGVTGFEGIIQREGMDATLAAADAFLARMRVLAAAIHEIGGFAGRREIIATAGGSSYFDRVLSAFAGPWRFDVPVRVVLRSGCYVTHDHGTYARTSPLGARGVEPDFRLRPALELWGAVLSRPEPDLVLLNFGRRDAPFDAGLPVPIVARDRAGAVRPLDGRLTVTALNDQHAFVQVPAGDPLAVGDLVGCGISHPCTAFDKWRFIPVVDDDYTVVDTVETFF